MAAVKCVVVKDLPTKPGEVCFTEGGGISGMVFVCPCGCGDVAQIDFKVAGAEGDSGRDRWEWNGDTERPTLTPSLQKIDGCRWHGWLTNGMFVN